MSKLEADVTAFQEGLLRYYEEELRVRIEAPWFATPEERDWVRRRTRCWAAAIDWDAMVAPEFTARERELELLRRRERMAAAVLAGEWDDEV